MPDTVAHKAGNAVGDFASWWQPWGVLVLSGGVAVAIGKTVVNHLFGLSL